MTLDIPGAQAAAPKPIPAADTDLALGFFRQMCFIRSFEEKALALSIETPPRVAGSVHLCAGQEAVPVGAMAALRPGDMVVATYRGHGWALSSGIPPYEVMAELCHREAGVNGGRAGSAYMMAPWHGFLVENSIVGAGVPIACGAALAAATRSDGAVTVVSFGDGAMSQGALHEGFVFAANRNLPVIFICENNGWSELTPTKDIVRIKRLAQRASGYGFTGITIDGADPCAVRETVRLAAEEARAGKGPVLIECTVPRLWGHYNRDIEHYRPKEDRASAQERDPIVAMARRLHTAGIADAAATDRLRAEVASEVEALTERALAAPPPDTKDARRHVFAESAPSRKKTAASRGTPIAATYIQAINEALRRELAARPEVLVYGEDVGKSGGIFAAARNLQREFGAERVFDTPIAESAILGSAVGAALAGMRPIVEIMWHDFILVALDQLINQAANIRYVTRGRAGAPLVVRTQQGALPGSCAQHSQCLEALLCHVPGLKIGMPATPQDAYAMLRAAAADPDPVVIIEARGLYQTRDEVDYDAPAEAVGGARVARDGSDIAIIAWSTMIGPALQAAEALRASKIEALVLDLRWLAPLDDAAIDEAIRRCGGRALIVHEANLTGGFGAEIAARICERHPGVRLRRCGAPDIRMPAAPALQAALLPDQSAIVAAARAVLGAN